MWNEFSADEEVSEDTQLAVMIVELEDRLGERYKLATQVPSVNSFKQLYFPSVDRSLHGTFVGYSPDHIEYYIFKAQSLSSDECEKMVKELTDQGWYEPDWG